MACVSKVTVRFGNGLVVLWGEHIPGTDAMKDSTSQPLYEMSDWSKPVTNSENAKLRSAVALFAG